MFLRLGLGKVEEARVGKEGGNKLLFFFSFLRNE